jgi:rod shape-determining protein MreC
MMMTARSRQSSGIWGWVIALVALIVVLLFGTPVGSFFRELVSDITHLGPADPAYASLSKNELISRIKADEQELSRIKYQAVLYAALADENTQLKKAASVQSFTKTVIAKVISRPPQTLYDTLLLDAGSVSGISEGDFVVFNNVALGSVVSVSPTSALVRLYSTPQVETDALLGNPRATAVAHGMGGGAYELELPKNVVVAANDSVIFPGSDILILGFVVSANQKPSDATQTVFVRSPVSMSELDYVSVIPRVGL